MKIIILTENTVDKTGLKAEHGLSVFISDDDGKKILFDTGQTNMFAENASILEADLLDIDSCVLSHGHYDHCGGLPCFLNINKKAKIYTQKEAFYPKYSEERYIGMPKIENMEDRIVYSKEPIWLSENVILFNKIQITNKDNLSFDNLKIKKNEIIEQDTLEEEQFLAIKKNSNIYVITACSHRGIDNIIDTAEDYFKDIPINTIIGGLHLKKASELKMKKILEKLESRNIKKLIVCHCTGLNEYCFLKNNTNKIDVNYAQTGDRFFIN